MYKRQDKDRDDFVFIVLSEQTPDKRKQINGYMLENMPDVGLSLIHISLAPLIKIARVLGVRLGTFLDDQDEVGPVVCQMCIRDRS